MTDRPTWGRDPLPPKEDPNKLPADEMALVVQGHMYRVMGGHIVEVVRHGDQLLPVTDPLVRETIGQGTLNLYTEDGDENPTI